MPESPIRTHLRLVRAGSAAETAWGRLRKAIPDNAIVLIGRAERSETEAGQPESLLSSEPPARHAATIGRHLRVIAGGLTGTGWGLTRTIVPGRAIVPVGRREAIEAQPSLPRKHMLMLALALEILCVGALYAANPPRPGISVEEPLTTGNVVT